MISYLWVRHALVPDEGKIYGRTGIHLSEHGRVQAEALGEALRGAPLAAIYSSPQTRTQQTAQAIAANSGLTVQIEDALDELDYGEWTGKAFADLRNQDPRWRHYNTFRSATRIPGGELMLEIQVRALNAMLRLRSVHPSKIVALVTHGDVIRAALAYALGMPLDLALRMEIGTASISIVRLDEGTFRVAGVNLPGPALKSGELVQRLS